MVRLVSVSSPLPRSGGSCCFEGPELIFATSLFHRMKGQKSIESFKNVSFLIGKTVFGGFLDVRAGTSYENCHRVTPEPSWRRRDLRN